LALRSGNPHRLRNIAERLLEKCEQGDLASMRELADRLDGRPAQIIDSYDNVPAERLPDEQLYAIAGRKRSEPDPVLKALPPPAQQGLAAPPTSPRTERLKSAPPSPPRCQMVPLLSARPSKLPS
jgi:hypothetical protein